MKHPVMKNAAWIIGCRIVQSLLQLVVGMLCARYLGPGNYGILSYAGAVLAFALPFMRLGLNETLVKELSDHPGQDGEIMGTAMGMNLLSALVTMGMVLGAVSALNPGDKETILVCGLYSLSLLTGAVEMIRYWFQYRMLASRSAVVALLAYLLVSAYRIALLAAGKSVAWFALTNALDYGLMGGALVVLFLRRGYRFRFSPTRAREMLRRSAPYIGASLMVVLYQSTDRVMLTALAGARETGLYTAAVSCVTMGQFVYAAMVDSARPVILASREEEGFQHRMSRLYGAVVYLAAAQGVIFTLAAEKIICLLYGEAYLEAVPVLRVLNGYFIFSCMGLVRNVWILAREKQRYLWRMNLAGAAVNILLNVWWIPGAGALGAAAASLLTQFFVNFLMGWLVRPIREANFLLLQGLNPVNLVQTISWEDGYGEHTDGRN